MPVHSIPLNSGLRLKHWQKCWRPFVGKHYDLARQMCNYWTNFAKKGNPNGLDADGTPMPEWRPYTKEEPYIMLFWR